jgi:hypothetical protein
MHIIGQEGSENLDRDDHLTTTQTFQVDSANPVIELAQPHVKLTDEVEKSQTG